MALPTQAYVSGNWSTPRALNVPVFSSPFPRLNTPYVCTVEYTQKASAFVPCPLGTLFTDNATNPQNATLAEAFTAQGLDPEDFQLVSESDRQTEGVNVRWTRTYAAIPARFEEPMTATYGFIAFYPGFNQISNGVLNGGREGFSSAVDAVCVYDFAEVEDLSDFTTLPIIYAQRYGFQASGPPLNPGLYPDYLTTGMLYPLGQFAPVETYPTLGQYTAWINETGTGNPDIQPLGGTAEFQDAYKYWMVAEDSTRETWMGLIVMRKTILIRPQ